MKRRIPITQIATDEQFYFLAGQLESYIFKLFYDDYDLFNQYEQDYLRVQYQQGVFGATEPEQLPAKCNYIKEYIAKLMSCHPDKLPVDSDFYKLISNFIKYNPKTDDDYTSVYMFFNGKHSDNLFYKKKMNKRK